LIYGRENYIKLNKTSPSFYVQTYFDKNEMISQHWYQTTDIKQLKTRQKYILESSQKRNATLPKRRKTN
jgi:hypothetical protein